MPNNGAKWWEHGGLEMPLEGGSSDPVSVFNKSILVISNIILLNELQDGDVTTISKNLFQELL